MMRLRKIFLTLVVTCFLSVNYGCIAIFAAGAITGVGQYVKYTMDNIAHRTFVADLQQVTLKWVAHRFTHCASFQPGVGNPAG